MSTEKRERTDAMRLAEADDHLGVLVHKLRAVEAAARGSDTPPESEGVSWVVADVWREVEGVQDLIRGVKGRLGENGSRPHGDDPQDDGPVTLSEDVLGALALAVNAINLASDGELRDHRDPDPRSYKAIWRDISDRVDPVLREALERKGVDLEAYERPFLDTVNAIVEGEAEGGES